LIRGGIIDTPLSPLFKGGKADFILEVGSGTRGITAFLDLPVVGVDVAFPGDPAAGMTALKASATALPLKNGSFATVVCSDMLEHLPDGVRKEAVGELLRVTRGKLFLACPNGSAARRADGLLGRLYRLLHLPVPDWLSEHLDLQLPDPEVIREALQEQRASCTEIKGEGVLAHMFVTLLISTKVANRFWAKLFQSRPARAKLLVKCPLLRLGPSYRRLWVVGKD
jgi:SAM-dependent methyltransferase